MGTAAVEGSVKWWARGHRAHHKYVDTDKDPYAIVKGFWYAHIGWMLAKQDKEREGHVNYQDLKHSKLLAWQNKYYLPLAALMVRSLWAAMAWSRPQAAAVKPCFTPCSTLSTPTHLFSLFFAVLCYPHNCLRTHVG